MDLSQISSSSTPVAYQAATSSSILHDHDRSSRSGFLLPSSSAPENPIHGIAPLPVLSLRPELVLENNNSGELSLARHSSAAALACDRHTTQAHRTMQDIRKSMLVVAESLDYALSPQQVDCPTNVTACI